MFGFVCDFELCSCVCSTNPVNILSFWYIRGKLKMMSFWEMKLTNVFYMHARHLSACVIIRFFHCFFPLLLSVFSFIFCVPITQCPPPTNYVRVVYAATSVRTHPVSLCLLYWLILIPKHRMILWQDIKNPRDLGFRFLFYQTQPLVSALPSASNTMIARNSLRIIALNILLRDIHTFVCVHRWRTIYRSSTQWWYLPVQLFPVLSSVGGVAVTAAADWRMAILPALTGFQLLAALPYNLLPLHRHPHTFNNHYNSSSHYNSNFSNISKNKNNRERSPRQSPPDGVCTGVTSPDARERQLRPLPALVQLSKTTTLSVVEHLLPILTTEPIVPSHLILTRRWSLWPCGRRRIKCLWLVYINGFGRISSSTKRLIQVGRYKYTPTHTHIHTGIHTCTHTQMQTHTRAISW